MDRREALRFAGGFLAGLLCPAIAPKKTLVQSLSGELTLTPKKMTAMICVPNELIKCALPASVLFDPKWMPPRLSLNGKV